MENTLKCLTALIKSETQYREKQIYCSKLVPQELKITHEIMSENKKITFFDLYIVSERPIKTNIFASKAKGYFEIITLTKEEFENFTEEIASIQKKGFYFNIEATTNRSLTTFPDIPVFFVEKYINDDDHQFDECFVKTEEVCAGELCPKHGWNHPDERCGGLFIPKISKFPFASKCDIIEMFIPQQMFSLEEVRKLFDELGEELYHMTKAFPHAYIVGRSDVKRWWSKRIYG